MLDLGREVARLPQQPSLERIQALKRIIPCSTLRAILKRRHTRFCPRLPDAFMLWFVVAIGLFCCDCYRQVFRWLQPFRRRGVPGRSTLCAARRRLGCAPLRWLTEAVVQLRATPAMAGAFYQGMRLMALDGFVVDLPDRPDLARVFGRPRSGRSDGAFPQARVLALCETGTHVLWKTQIKPVRRGEAVMAATLLRHLQPDMLLLWDRGFLSYANVTRVRQRRAHLLARIKKNLVFQPRRRLPDGSYLSRVYRNAADRAADRGGIEVRIIAYTFDDPRRPGAGPPHRLLTTLLDWRQHPAKTLIVLYHERWEEELAIDELKTHQRERPVLRSETVAGVVQEMDGLLLGHYVVRSLMVAAAAQAGVAPRRLSFVNTLKVLRCRLPEVPKSRQGLQRWYQDLVAEVAEEILDERRDRINPRVIRQKISRWPKKRPHHRHHPQPRKKIRRSIKMLR